MNKGVERQNYNSHHCGNDKRNDIMSSSICEDNFYYQNGMKGH